MGRDLGGGGGGGLEAVLLCSVSGVDVAMAMPLPFEHH